MEPVAREVRKHGTRIAYEVSGHGRPLILLHGWACDRSWWTHAGYRADLERDHRVVAIDLRGHGASDRPHVSAAYRREAVTRDVLAVADAEGLDRFAIWGLSYGGWVAWSVAHTAPARVAALVVTGIWTPLPETWDDSWQAFDRSWLEPMRRDGTPGLVAAFSREEHDAFLREPPAWARAMFLAGDADALLAIQTPELIGEGIPTLDDFPVPTLVIAGALEDPDDDAGKVARGLPNGSHLRLPDLGHGDACAAAELTIPTARASLDRWFPWV